MERARNPTLIRYYRGVALLTLALVFVQAVLAGRAQFVDADAIDIHEVVANVITVVVVAQVLLAVAAGFTPQLRLPLWSGALVVLVIAQTGLGYAGRDSEDAAAIHVPLGVLVFGVGMLTTVLAFFDTAEREG